MDCPTRRWRTRVCVICMVRQKGIVEALLGVYQEEITKLVMEHWMTSNGGRAE
jgi:hypothetical protein